MSHATALALHAVAMLAGREEGRPISVADLAHRLGASPDHLAKVMQRLARRSLVRSRRGPGGGFVLARPARRIRLLDVYEAVEGPFERRCCLLEHPVCRGGRCVMGGLLEGTAGRLRRHLETTTLADLAWPEPSAAKEGR